MWCEGGVVVVVVAVEVRCVGVGVGCGVGGGGGASVVVSGGISSSVGRDCCSGSSLYGSMHK
jgi:hypothetical protein